MLLSAGKAQCGAAGGFALHPTGAFAKGQNRHIGFLGRLDSFGNCFGVVWNGQLRIGGRGANEVDLPERVGVVA